MNQSPGSPAGQPLEASFRDPNGFIFSYEGQIYRQINLQYQENYSHLIDSGLYNALLNAGLIIRHEEVNIPAVLPDRVYKIIQPDPLRFVSYPYEWSFSQLKDAARTTLQIQKTALKFGMSLKDSSAYNVQFHGSHPCLIDTLSFEMYKEGKPWVAYRQFCQHFLAPLSLMAYRDTHLSQLLKFDLDGLPLDFTSRLLPWRTRMVPALLLHIHLHAASQKRYASAGSMKLDSTRQVTRNAMLGLIDSLDSAIERLEWKRTATSWADYYLADHNYTPEALEHKKQIVVEYLEQIKPGIVWDLGANTGMFSRLASERGAFTLAFDSDPGAVELCYRESRSKNENLLLPLLQDLTNPSPGIGWQNQERAGLIERANADAIMALALIHHLAIGNNLPFDRLASFFHRLGQWLIIEFVPKDDSQVQRLLAAREDIFYNYTIESFELAFQSTYSIQRVEQIHGSDRRLYLMEGR